MGVCRAVLMVLAVAAAGVAGMADAQTSGRGVRIALLCGVRCEGPTYDALKEGLRHAGWIEGRNLTMDIRGGEGRPDRLAALAADMVAAGPDLIIAVAPQPARAVKNATSTIPVVFLFVADPVGVGLVRSLARPGGNITGFSTLVPGGFIAKQLEILKEAVPHARRFAALVNPNNDVARLTFGEEVPPAAARLGIELEVVEARNASEIDGAVGAAMRGRAEGLLVVGDPIFHVPPGRVPELAARARLASIYLVRDLVVAGGLMSYGPNFTDIARRSAVYVDLILKGARPADLPIEQPSKYDLVINQRTARTLGITIPPGLLLRADHVIE